MQVKFGCYECIFGQLLRLCALADKDEAKRAIMHECLDVLQKHINEFSPVEMAANFFTIAARYTGITDNYIEVKDRSTALALELYEELEKYLQSAPDPFMSALKFAIGGNIIDFGVLHDFNLETAAAEIKKVEKLDCDTAAAADFKARIEKAGKILYILDNCGEAVLDRLLLEYFADKVTVGFRGKPIMNDVTVREYAASGLGKFPSVDTGDCSPGVALNRCSAEFKAALESADLIIAKGQGNFESLESEFTAKPIFFLFRTKCRVICQYVDAELNSLQIIGKNLDK